VSKTFFAIFKISFRKIKARFFKDTEVALACTCCIELIIKTINRGAKLSNNRTSFCVCRIADSLFYNSKIAPDATNHNMILLTYLQAILQQNLKITKFIQSIESIASQKSKLLNVVNTPTDLLFF